MFLLVRGISLFQLSDGRFFVWRGRVGGFLASLYLAKDFIGNRCIG